MIGTMEERVAAGMALLDEQEPGWRERITLERLDMSSCHACVLGQVYRDYDIGAKRLGFVDIDGHVIYVDREQRATLRPAAYGFAIYRVEETDGSVWQENPGSLTEVWQGALRER